jgi:peptidoglycan/xylan/chitin deacetylase (PgdA/CDA1 family)
MFPILMRHKFPVTLFINPPAIGQGGAYLTWAMIGEMIKSGLVDVQPHTQSHPNFNTEREHRDASGFRDFVAREISASRAAIIAHLGLPADMLAWPFGIHDAELEKAAAGAGCVAAFALGSHPVVNGDPDFALPRYQIYDTDRASRFGWIVAGNPRKPLAKKVSA